MGLSKIKIRKFRKELRKSGFFDEVIFKKSTSDEEISRWIYCLKKYKYIRIKKFKDLFSKLEEIVFPITFTQMHGSYWVHMEFCDAKGKKYYMVCRGILDFDSMQNYIIGRKNTELEPLVERDFHYKISEDGSISLYESGAMKLKEDGTNTDILATFCYDNKKNITEAVLECLKNKITFKYQTRGDDFDKKVLKILFDINEDNWVYYNVEPLLKKMLVIMLDEKISISITASIDEETYSEITVVDNIVQKYVFTEVISEAEMRITKRIFSKELKEFLKETAF